jgi:Ca2+-transporting ATPase
VVAHSDDFSHVGLSSSEASIRLQAEGANELPTEDARNTWHIFLELLKEPMIFLIVAAGIIFFLLAEVLDGIILMTAISIAIVITVFQQRKTEGALSALRDLSSPHALVVRDGVRIRIPGRDIVRGDYVLISEGDRIPADATLCEGSSITVDESILTGESIPVRKEPDNQMGNGAFSPNLFSGTLVVAGHGAAIVTATGIKTELGHIGTALQSIGIQRTQLQRDIDRLVRIFAVVGLSVAVGVIVVYGLTRESWLEGALAGIATAMSLLPAEFPVVLTIFVALGSWRMSQERVLARRPAVIETLGSATVICVDKTGTLTMNSMTVSELIVNGMSHTVNDEPLPDAFHTIVEYAALASPIHTFDPMDRAFRQLAERKLAASVHDHTEWELTREYPLSSQLLALTHVWDAQDDSHFIVAAKGAPESIADLCHLDDEERLRLLERVTTAANNGLRVLAVATARFERNTPHPDSAHSFNFSLLGLACLHDPVRPGVAQAVSTCAAAGVRTVMITGDFPGTALAVAREIGIEHGNTCITGPEMAEMTPADLAERVRTVNVFARMIPEQKLQLIRALKTNGEVVGMTGDGVNDAPALRAADIGIAMGARGTDVAREAAALVITDDDFSSITAGIRRGRGIFDNLRKAMSYLIAVHVHLVGIAIIPLFAPAWPLVLLPLQISFLQLIIDPTSSIVFEMEEIDPDIMTIPPRPVGSSLFDKRSLSIAIAQGLTVLISVLVVYFWSVRADQPDDVVRSITFTTLVLSNLGLLLVNRSWRLPLWKMRGIRRNPAAKWIITATLLVLTAMMAMPFLRDAFHFGELSLLQCGAAVAAAFVGVAWFELFKLFSSKS